MRGTVDEETRVAIGPMWSQADGRIRKGPPLILLEQRLMAGDA